MSLAESQHEKSNGLADFCFTDIDVFTVKKANNFSRDCALIPFPKRLEKEKNCEILFAWNLWLHLILIMRKKLRSAKQRIKRKDRKECVREDRSKPMATFSYTRDTQVIAFTVEPWAAKILGLAAKIKFSCPPDDPLKAYTEIALTMNGHKNPSNNTP